jgi:hypothetical protein
MSESKLPCAGINRDGSKCRRHVLVNSKYCHSHRMTDYYAAHRNST